MYGGAGGRWKAGTLKVEDRGEDQGSLNQKLPLTAARYNIDSKTPRSRLTALTPSFVAGAVVACTARTCHTAARRRLCRAHQSCPPPPPPPPATMALASSDTPSALKAFRPSTFLATSTPSSPAISARSASAAHVPSSTAVRSHGSGTCRPGQSSPVRSTVSASYSSEARRRA